MGERELILDANELRHILFECGTCGWRVRVAAKPKSNGNERPSCPSCGAPMLEMEHDSFLEEYRQGLSQGLRETLDFYSNDRKGERERLVCASFLEVLGVTFDGPEVVDVPDQPPDVMFREARFEIKEVLDSGRRRTEEYKKALRTVNEIHTSGEILEEFEPLSLTPPMIISALRERMPEWGAHYEPRVCASLDLLVYDNRHRIPAEASTAPTRHELIDLIDFGFRSVSVFTNAWSWVLAVRPAAPAFLRARVGQLVEAT